MQVLAHITERASRALNTLMTSLAIAAIVLAALVIVAIVMLVRGWRRRK